MPSHLTPCVCVCVCGQEDLAFSGELLLVAARGVSGNLAGPQAQPHHQISTTHHQQGQEVDQHSHTHIVTVERRKKGGGDRGFVWCGNHILQNVCNH